MIDQNCLVCFGLCWVCENDPIRRDEKLGGQCGAGMPSECQRANGLEQPDFNNVLETDDVEISFERGFHR